MLQGTRAGTLRQAPTIIVDSGHGPLNASSVTRLGQMTELIGLAGLGKTQLSLQCTVSVLKDGHGVLYIDTEGSFNYDRLYQMNSSIVFDHLFVYRILDVPQLLSLVGQIEEICEKEQIRLIIVDSIAFLFRGVLDYGQRSQWLNSIAQTLKKVAHEHDVLVIVTNQMTTKVNSGSGNSVLVPALGDSWGHVCNNRIFMFWKDGIRRMYLAKSSISKEETWDFWITVRQSVFDL